MGNTLETYNYPCDDPMLVALYIIVQLLSPFTLLISVTVDILTIDLFDNFVVEGMRYRLRRLSLVKEGGIIFDIINFRQRFFSYASMNKEINAGFPSVANPKYL